MPRQRLWFRAPLALSLALASLIFSKLSLFAALGSFLAWASSPGEAAQRPAYERWLLALSAVLSAVALLRFLVHEAVPGIVAGGNRSTEQRAVSRLREILFAEDSARRLATHDPDRDGIGSALLLGELSGELGVRGGRPLSPALLESYPRLVATPLGPSVELGGYLMTVCLPQPGGGFSAEPSAAVDDELGERRFIAYAWPSEAAPGLNSAVALDEHEHIWLAPAVRGRVRSGFKAPPRCDDVLAPETRADWKSWRGKQPRTRLPVAR